MAAASSALAVTRYRRAAFNSQATSNAVDTRTPMATRTGGSSQPCSIEYRRKKIAAMTSATPAIAENSLTPMRFSQSNAGMLKDGRAGGGAIGGFGGGDGCAMGRGGSVLATRGTAGARGATGVTGVRGSAGACGAMTTGGGAGAGAGAGGGAAADGAALARSFI